MARVAAAQASRSARNFGKMMPLLVPPTWCPARPIRCIPLATEFTLAENDRVRIGDREFYLTRGKVTPGPRAARKKPLAPEPPPAEFSERPLVAGSRQTTERPCSR